MAEKEFVTKYKGCTIYSDSNDQYYIDDCNMIFFSIQEVKDYIDYSYDDDVDEMSESMMELSEQSRRKKKKPAMGWFTSFLKDPEKSMDIFNHNNQYNDSFDGEFSSPEASEGNYNTSVGNGFVGGGDSSGGGE